MNKIVAKHYEEWCEFIHLEVVTVGGHVKQSPDEQSATCYQRLSGSLMRFQKALGRSSVSLASRDCSEDSSVHQRGKMLLGFTRLCSSSPIGCSRSRLEGLSGH